jgi:hypothetical protein
LKILHWALNEVEHGKGNRISIVRE